MDCLPGEPVRIERVFTDITEAYRLDEEIRRIRKAEVTGDALVSVVKILNSLNESLTRCSELLKNAPGEDKTVQHVAETLLRNAGRSSKYARQLLSVSENADRVSTVVDLNTILAENDSVLRKLAGEDIGLEMECSGKTSLVAGDRGEITQLILNLVMSSLKSLPLGGMLSVGTENIEFIAPASEGAPNIPPGMYVLMTISADGFEVQPETPATFNQTIVDKMGGWMDTINDPQSGNVHKVYFPRVVTMAGRKILTPNASDA
jgi:signal transduction histidine kinase